MGNPGRVARVGDDGGQLVGNPEAPFSQSEQHHATIRADPPAIESGGHFLRQTDGKANGKKLSSNMAGVAVSELAAERVSATKS